MIEDYDIVGSFNAQRYLPFDSERTVNMFEYIDPDGKKPKALFPTSGLINTNSDFQAQTGGFRAQFVFNDLMYMVVGTEFFVRNLAGTTSALGTLATSAGYCGIDANTFQIIIVDGLRGYIYDTIAETFTEISDTAFPDVPVDCCYLDGFFVVANGGTNAYQISSFNQGLVWGGSPGNLLDPTPYVGAAATDLLTVSSTDNFPTGIPVTLGGAGVQAVPLLASNTTYFVIKISATTIKLATTYENAIAGIAIDLTVDSSGTVTITNNGQVQQGAMTSHPGTIVACRTLHRRLFLFSQFYIEGWENSGFGSNLPFRRNNAWLIEVGTPSVASICVGFDKMFFLSQDRDGLSSVMEVEGIQANPISNRAIDFQLAQYAATPNVGVADARGVLIKENGLIFYRLNFTRADHTYVYNVSMSDPQNVRWHEEQTLRGNRHPAQTHAFFNGLNFYGDYDLPILYQVDTNTYTNAGENIERIRIGKPIVPKTYQRIRIDRFQLDLVQGDLSQINDPNINPDFYPYPIVYLSQSRDGGQTYGAEIPAPMGAVGQRTFRTLWRKLGATPRGQAWVPQIKFFNNTLFAILGASLAYEVLPE